ncbi:hypothetical protein DAPPUDRAFT_328135 [Daphnia pulex]|uniref:Uncharacterized protein n=1 Tax=Daphnia pulex TaxID=6669 RepID=E9HD13_DAPPU|nr:hypothetical protein DAPPUDRAFT_328135 [Daphnia pulex]|eukprot:EFX70374.1 hypothetical protein DAPPUDRAFT_328135 [Daphnia pulex]
MTRSNPTSSCFCAPDSRQRCAVKEIGREYPAAEEAVQRSITWHPVTEDVIIKANGS